MNQTRFNLNRFNQGSGESLIVLALRLNETVGGLFQVSDITNHAITFYELVSAETQGFAGRLYSGFFSEEIGAAAEITGIKAPRELAAELSEGIEARVSISEVRNLDREMTEGIEAAVTLVQVRYTSISFTEIVTAAVTAGEVVSRGADFYEVISAVVEAEANEERVLALKLTLRPGDKLVIDSENYVVLMVPKNGGEVNVIHTHSGDWIDALSRETRSLQVESGATRDLSASILYTERFL